MQLDQKKHHKYPALTVTRFVGSPASLVIHSLFFMASFFAVWVNWLQFDRMLLILTTIVSLEAIYLAIFIQMTINYTTKELEDVGEDIDEIQKDIDEIQEDVDEIQEDVDVLQEDVEDISEDEAADAKRKSEQKITLVDIRETLKKLTEDIERLRQHHGPSA